MVGRTSSFTTHTQALSLAMLATHMTSTSALTSRMPRTLSSSSHR